VLCAVGLGANVREAQRAAYLLADEIHWSGAQFRRDIGYRAVERERAAAATGNKKSR
jgi:phosphoribosylamine--glycine ligase